ncbi:MAG: C39 family peptidase [Patescibacteria group bacterium]
MKKIYLVIAGAFLILLVITTMLLSLVKKPTSTNRKDSAFPTGIPDQGKTGQSINNLPSTGGDQGLKDLSQSTDLSTEALAKVDLNISTIAPVETEDFKLQYSYKLKKIVVEKKTPQGEEQFINWAKQNQLTPLVNNADLTLIVDQGKNPDDFNPVIEFLNIFMNMGQGDDQGAESSTSDFSTSNPTLTPVLTSSLTPSSEAQPTTTSFTYYAQCGDQGSLPLPDGGTLCSAGCGPTTVAMISSSYMDKKYDPKTVVGLYKSNDYLLGNDGSRYTDAHELLKGLGLKTTDYLTFNLEKADTVAPQLKKYLNAGWTFFALARFCDDPKKGYCGHIFWITDIDAKGNIIAYDPAYGRYEIPYNENSRYPYPLYRLAFGIKK